MPAHPIVDAHLHLWDPTHFRMSWLDGLPTLDRPHTLADYGSETAGLAIEAMVYLQVEVDPAYGLLEAGWAIDRATEDPRLQGVVAFAPVEYGDQVRAYLDALTDLGPLVKGVRRIIQYEPDPEFCLQPRFVRGVQILADYGLSFDLCIDHTQLPPTIRLVEQCSAVSFVLDHIAKPDIRGRRLDPWRRDLTELAAFPNVVCKLSGLLTEADHQTWTVSDLAPYVDHVLAVFGEDRILFGGDWPVMRQAGTYPRLVAAIDDLMAKLPEEAARKIWAENAKRVYRLEKGLSQSR